MASRRFQVAERAPVVALLEECRVHYEGRAKAEQVGGTLVVVVKADGAVAVQSLDSGVKPQFYNPAGQTVVRRRRGRLHIHSEARTGEVLVVSGQPVVFHEAEEPGGKDRPARTRIRGTEDDLVTWIQEGPELVDVKGGTPSREVGTVGGRVDLRFDDVVVEVKARAGVRAYDQALRYLRDPEVRRVVVACLHASSGLTRLSGESDAIEVVELDADAFEEWLDGRPSL